MADPKYTNLPGIAYDQPDVYETSDLPEVDQAGSAFDVGDESESVERIDIHGADAFNKFKGKKLDAKRTDFSDRISRERRIGYDADNGEFEMAEDGCKDETILQKYHRLQHESKTLMEDIQVIQKAVKDGKEVKTVSQALTVKQVEQLQKQLVDIHLEEILASDVVASLTDPQASLQKKLLAQIEELTTVQVSGQKEKAPKSNDDKLVYELHFKPEQSKFHQTAKTAEFEQRLQKLEEFIGQEPEKTLILANDTSHKTLWGAVTVLNSKMNLLDPDHLDQIEARLQVLGHKLLQMNEKKASLENVDRESKVSAAFELLTKIHDLKSLLPGVVDRMIALQQLHEQSLQFSKALTQLDVAQQQVENNLQDNKALLKQIQANFNNNLDMINKNMASLGSRLSALKK